VGTTDLEITSSGVYPVGQAMDWAIELIADAGTALAGLGGLLAGSGAGETLAGTLGQVERAFQNACLELVGGATRLSELLDASVRCYLGVDTEAAYRFGRVTVHD
jgi:hypothetical protein